MGGSRGRNVPSKHRYTHVTPIRDLPSCSNCLIPLPLFSRVQSAEKQKHLESVALQQQNQKYSLIREEPVAQEAKDSDKGKEKERKRKNLREAKGEDEWKDEDSASKKSKKGLERSAPPPSLFTHLANSVYFLCRPL